MKVSDYKALYASEASEILQALEEGVISLEKGDNLEACIEDLFRNAHNLKGMSGAMGYDTLVEASHALENVLDSCKRGEMQIKAAETDLLLRATDLLRELLQWTLDEESGPKGEDLLGEILVLLAPMSMRAGAGDEAFEGSDDSVSEDDESDDEQDGPPPSSAEEEIKESTGVQTRITSTRVDLKHLDSLMDLVGELIISRIRLTSIAREIDSRPLLDELNTSGRLVSEIQKEVMEARLIPVGQVFHRFKRLFRDISKDLEKKVHFEILGSDIGLDKMVLESMADPLVHLIRNAIDHGVESPAERKAYGKPETANVTLQARRERNLVIIEVKDDGRGIDFEKIDSGLRPESPGGDSTKRISEEELCRILTTPGFSTKEEVNRYSGRGIGMNVVKETIDSLGGELHISSEPGHGTTISMHLPVNLSIIKALLFYVGDEVHALPIEYVKETTRVESGIFETVRGREVMRTKDGPLAIVRPDQIFRMEPEGYYSRFIKVIIVNVGDRLVGLVVKRILGQQDVVIKGLPSMIRGVSGISGATIMGSGRIAFIWDPRILFQGRSTYESDQEAVVLED